MPFQVEPRERRRVALAAAPAAALRHRRHRLVHHHSAARVVVSRPGGVGVRLLLSRSSSSSKTLLFGTDVPGFPTLIISVMFFAGVQLISLGVIGEYLGRVYEEVKGRPLFVVSREIGLGGEVPRAPATGSDPATP